ncbi:MAG TPA: S-methyl-5-thioribose-1-phosphate isomerase [Lachnospiraceae bacterium]|nr:S-methyl-5-thioribose-1-phosphate isomerase [Lachnospiraceae bacterium]
MGLVYKESDPVRLSDDRKQIIALDQTRLPGEEVFLRISKRQEMYDAIKTLAVRGAPCIGVFAGYCMAVLAAGSDVSGSGELLAKLKEDAAYLDSSRPTAVNLSWALKRQMAVAEEGEAAGITPGELTDRLYEEAVRIHEEDIAMCMKIAENGLSLLHDGDGILTHCNAGALATTRYGTGLGPILLGKERGYEFHVYSDETRPLLQGARLTAYELVNAGVDETVVCDNMASLLMKQGRIQAVLVGCDRVAANGDAANKIGTSGVAILAKYYGIPFYVLGPYSTIDPETSTGDDIEIEERDPEEIKTMWYEKPMAPAGAKCFNPAFDVTDHSLITAIITDRGILRPPYTESIAEALKTHGDE